MADLIPILWRHPLVGSWRDPDLDMSAEFTVGATLRGFVVEGVDLDDGEQFEVWGVSWDGKTLSFTSRMPSTNHVVEHEFRLDRDGNVSHRFHIEETWVKAKLRS
jgi:hypothetical protein